MATLTHDELKTAQRERREAFPSNMGLRVHRAISWIGRAEQEVDDHDARFIFLWIAFNAAYADEHDFVLTSGSARRDFAGFFEQLIRLDAGHRIYNAIWEKFAKRWYFTSIRCRSIRRRVIPWYGYHRHVRLPAHVNASTGVART